MTKSATVRARMEPDIKEKAENILADLGLSPTDGVSLFYRQLVLRKGLPFDVRLPNAETQAAMNDVLEGNTEAVSSVDALFDDLDDI